MELIERDHAVAALLALVDSAITGEGRAGVVRAPAGGGKTSVLRAVSRLAAERGVAVMAAVGVEQETVIPYGVVHQLVDPLVRSDPDLVADGPAARAWRQLESGAATDPSVPRGLHWLIADAAESRPALVLVDDHQGADRPSMAFIDYLAHRIGQSPMALIVATRDASTTLDLGPATDVVGLDLEPLTPTGVRAVTLARLGHVDDETLAALGRATGGNPFLLSEALTVLADHPAVPPDEAVSADMTAQVRRRLRGLDAEAGRVAEALAVLGPAPSPDVVAEVADLDGPTTAKAGDRLVAAHLTNEEAPLALHHPLVCNALLQAMPPALRTTLHRRSADAIARRGGSVLDVGQHLLQTQPGSDLTVAIGLLAAGQAALDRGDPEAARVLLGRARGEPPPESERVDLALALGTAHRRLGDERAVDEFRLALELADRPDRRIAALRGLLAALLAFGRLEELDAAMADELEQVASDDAETAVTLEAELLSAARHATHATFWNAGRLRRWAGRVTGRSPAERVLLANLATQAALDGGSAETTAELARMALRGHDLIDEQGADSLAVYQPIWQLTAAEALDEAEAALEAALADARRRGSVTGYALASVFSSYVELARGDVAAAEADANAALEAAEQVPGQWMVRPAIVAAMIDVQLERDETGPAWALLDRQRLTGDLPDSTPHRLLLYSRARLHDASAHAEAAVDDAEELVRRQKAANVLSAHLVPCRAIAAVAHAGLGDMARAHQRSEENLGAASAWGSPRVVGRAVVTHARLQPPDAAAATLDQSLDVLSRSPSRLDLGWAHYQRGITLVRLGRRDFAAADLRSALDLAAACGATRLERSARQALVHLGFRPRRAAITGLRALTVSERQVAELAARGHTNRDIAASMFVTPRTVEAHLTSTYRKLGIAGRAQLPGALGPLA